MNEMNEERKKELLAYAAVCFNHATSPFETMHLVKKNVTLDECGDLSFEISCLLSEEVSRESMEKAEKEFQETQED